MATLLTPVSVAANRTSTTEVHLLKGATIAGTIRFDDGTPDAATGVSLLGRDKSGKWSNFRTKLLAGPFSSTLTDDQGRFRITGLPAGEYLLKTTLELSDVVVDHIFRESGSSSSNTRYSLDIYSGNFMRQRDAKPIKLTGAEDSAGNDIEIPLTTLHAISGTVLEGATGRTVNAAHVAIHYTDDDAQLVSANVSKEDNTFHFLYVPEGEYTLKITEARDVTRTEVPTCPNSPSRCLPPHIPKRRPSAPSATPSSPSSSTRTSRALPSPSHPDPADRPPLPPRPHPRRRPSHLHNPKPLPHQPLKPWPPDQVISQLLARKHRQRRLSAVRDHLRRLLH